MPAEPLTMIATTELPEVEIDDPMFPVRLIFAGRAMDTGEPASAEIVLQAEHAVALFRQLVEAKARGRFPD